MLHKKRGRFSKNLPRFLSPTFFFFISGILQNRFCFHEKSVVLCRSIFGSFLSLLPPPFLYFLALQHSNIKECLWNRRSYLCFSCLYAHLWRLWKQKVQFCRMRARTRTRETLILRLFKSQFFSEHRRVAFRTSHLYILGDNSNIQSVRQFSSV